MKRSALSPVFPPPQVSPAQSGGVPRPVPSSSGGIEHAVPVVTAGTDAAALISESTTENPATRLVNFTDAIVAIARIRRAGRRRRKSSRR